MKIKHLSQDFLGSYDLSRTDKLFCLKIPFYHLEYGVVYYEINLKDLVTNEVYISHCRFREFKALHEKLVHLKVNRL